MKKLLLFLAICNQILSDPMLVFSVQEKIRPNAEEGDLLPLIVTPTVDVTEEIEIQCNGNIRYRLPDGVNPDLGDIDPKTKIPTGTKAGTIIMFNCIIDWEIKDTTIYLELDESMTDWSVDENNKHIRFTANYEAEKANEAENSNEAEKANEAENSNEAEKANEEENAKNTEDKGQEDKNYSINIKIVWKFMMALLILLF